MPKQSKVTIVARLESVLSAAQGPGPGAPRAPKQERRELPIETYIIREKASVLNKLEPGEQFVLGLVQTNNGFELLRSAAALPLDADTHADRRPVRSTFKLRFTKGAKRATVTADFPVQVKAADLRDALDTIPDWLFLITALGNPAASPTYRLYNTQGKDGGGAQPVDAPGGAAACFKLDTFEERLKCLIAAGEK